MYNETITFYSKTPPNKWIMKDFSIKHYEDNNICWDDLDVFLKIEDNKITDFSFDWETAIITTACASIFWESIIWLDINYVVKMKYEYIEELVWMPISPRRKQASVLWMLTTINAIHNYLDNWITCDFDNLID